MRLMSDEPTDREAILIALENVEDKTLDAIDLLKDMVVVYEGQNAKKNVDRSNDEYDINKIIEATDGENGSLKEFLSSSSRKPSSPVSDKLVESKQQESPPLEYNSPSKNPEETPQPLLLPTKQPPSSSADRKLER